MSIMRAFRRKISVRSMESADENNENEPLNGDEIEQSPLKRKFKAMETAFKKIINWKQNSTSSSHSVTSETISINNSIQIPDYTETLNTKYNLIKIRTMAGINKGWIVYDAEEVLNVKNKASVFIFKKESVVGPDRMNILKKIREGIEFMTALPLAPYFLAVKHKLVEGPLTMAFATEAVGTCLKDFFPSESESTEASTGPSTSTSTHHKKPLRQLEEIEIIYGLQQIIDGLMYLHFQKRIAYLNMCPSNIIITKRGVWKLFGFELAKKVEMKTKNFDITKAITNVALWSEKASPFCQPELNFMAPELLMRCECSTSSDIYSLGKIITYLFNNGDTLSNDNIIPIHYIQNLKHIEQDLNKLKNPNKPLHNILKRMMKLDPTDRPCTQGLARFCEDAEVDNALTAAEHRQIIAALQFAENLGTKSNELKHQYFEIDLMQALPKIPIKLRWTLVWEALIEDMWTPEPLKSIMNPLIWISTNASPRKFKKYVIPLAVRLINETSNKSRDFFLERFDCMVTASHYEVLNTELMPKIYLGYKNKYQIIRKSAVIISIALSEYLQESPELSTVYLEMIDILNDICIIDITVLIFKFFALTLKSMKDKLITRKMICTLLTFTRRYPLLFQHEIRSYSSALYKSKCIIATNLYIRGKTLDDIQTFVGDNTFNAFIDTMLDLIYSIKRNQVIIVTLVDDTIHDNLPDKIRARPRTNSNSNIPQWILTAGRKLSMTGSLIHRASVSEVAPTTSVELSRLECVSPKYTHRFLRGFGEGSYMDCNGTKNKLPSLSVLAFPQTTLPETFDSGLWVRLMKKYHHPQSPPPS